MAGLHVPKEQVFVQTPVHGLPPTVHKFDLPDSLVAGLLPALFGQVGTNIYGDLNYAGGSKVVSKHK